MCSLPCCQTSEAFGTSDLISIAAIFVSLFAIIIAFKTIRASKKLDVKYKEFEKLCLENVEKIFSELDTVFSGNNANSSIDKMIVTSVSTEFQIFIISLKKSVYSKIDINFLIDRIERFSESIYKYNNPSPSSFIGEYYSLKLDVYNYLYKHAISEEI